MIRIAPSDDDEPREFTAEESKEIIVVWHKLTKKASDRSMQAVAYYGELEDTDPEWIFLKNEIDRNMQDWAKKIRLLGGIPRELWTITWLEEGRKRMWRLDSGYYVLK